MSTARDLLELTKPGIVRMTALMTAGGLWLGAPAIDAKVWICALVGCSASVAAANAFNMVLEQDSDRLMTRTRERPIAAGRMGSGPALVFAWTLTIFGLSVLAWGTNLLSALLSGAAIAAYALVYTPLKQRTPAALVIGAFPGAMPPLLGFTAASGQISAPGLALFAILLVWQMPHFLAIALWRKEEYANAGIRCVPVARGDSIARIQAAVWAALLIPISASLTPLGVTGGVYLGLAIALGLAFLILVLTGLRSADRVWPRRVFLASLVYLPALTVAVFLDVMWG